MTLYILIAHIHPKRKRFRKAWLISDNGTAANDNGFAFFQHMRREHPDIPVFFVISKKNTLHYEKVAALGDPIEFMSPEHKLAFILSTAIISAHMWHIQPWSYKLYKLLFDRKDQKKAIFLQHGITHHDMSSSFSKKKTHNDLITTAAKQEFDALNQPEYGYTQGEIVLTGFARYDNLHGVTTKKQIVFMPSWRNTFVSPTFFHNKWISQKEFCTTNYFKRIQSFLQNSDLHTLLETHHFDFIFYPHYKMQRYLSNFHTASPHIHIENAHESDVPTLLRESQLLITDFSSVFFDFAYMKKPMIYYMFDPVHYAPSYFDHHTDGFGKIISLEEELIREIEKQINHGCAMEDTYLQRVDSFFQYRDTNNCDRIFHEIISIL
ncbi:CDP-glycerol glycerophosphotransferase family protein [Chitinivibrio alkaliphilus]|uniref:CDP-Glycerol:Poly(Glycerophosphate) glycerophosphotransferase n=1 Tax=Chitinivibrio alkaliphilus ACht1 TaxID=1313304 RepID=U7D8T5_9BACT|nr:CDP-glycerol glycerophosphotransferase family protein [Chitinivibrio alkaliphilus]ERP31512.1 CDP-Glycerol:Poly(glycerophosphate) glycerophosphotransferase [Chitinivibrio alkaliphilus ACht1]